MQNRKEMMGRRGNTKHVTATKSKYSLRRKKTILTAELNVVIRDILKSMGNVNIIKDNGNSSNIGGNENAKILTADLNVVIQDILKSMGNVNILKDNGNSSNIGGNENDKCQKLQEDKETKANPKANKEVCIDAIYLIRSTADNTITENEEVSENEIFFDTPLSQTGALVDDETVDLSVQNKLESECIPNYITKNDGEEDKGEIGTENVNDNGEDHRLNKEDISTVAEERTGKMPLSTGISDEERRKEMTRKGSNDVKDEKRTRKRIPTERYQRYRNIFEEKEKANKEVRYGNLSEDEIAAIFYILWTRYYEISPENMDVVWEEDDMMYVDTIPSEEEIMKWEDKVIQIRFSRPKEEEMLSMMLDTKKKVFSISGRCAQNWFDTEKELMEKLVEELVEEFKQKYFRKKNLTEIQNIRTHENLYGKDENRPNTDENDEERDGSIEIHSENEIARAEEPTIQEDGDELIDSDNNRRDEIVKNTQEVYDRHIQSTSVEDKMSPKKKRENDLTILYKKRNMQTQTESIIIIV